MNAHPIISGRSLAYRYPSGPQALVEVDIAVSPREIVVVIGPNGSGKSTLVKVLSGLLAPDAGAVFVAAETRLDALGPSERARAIALVPQFLPAVPEVTVRTFVTGGRYAHRRRGLAALLLGRALDVADQRAADDALRACDALELAERPMTELSGGQRQRALIARAVAQAAAALLVDEPTNALDPEHQIQVFELVRSLSERGRGALVVTHDLNLAGQFATRIVLMNAGRVVIDASPERVLRRAVLEPVYGPHLAYIDHRDAAGRSLSIVVPARGTP